MERIYMDNAATMPVYQEAIDVMIKYMTEVYANPAAVYSYARQANDALRDARESIAKHIGAQGKEIYFTSGGTEGNNWALESVFSAYKHKGNHIITSKIEHHSILNTLSYLEKKGAEVTYLDVDKNGFVDLNQLKSSIKDSTILISVMGANNEIGTIQNIGEIGRIAKENNILYHIDAVQFLGHVPIDVKEVGADILTAGAHKFGGPKGVGFNYFNKEIDVASFMHGGSQERNLRAGTQNVPGIAAMAKALDITMNEREKKEENVKAIADHMKKRILTEIPDTFLNGDEEKRLCNNINVVIKGVESEAMLILLDQKNICASAGSACASGSMQPSHVLLAIGRTRHEARSAVRFTLSENNTMEEADYVVDSLKEIVEKLR